MSYYDDWDWGREVEEQREIERGFEIDVAIIMQDNERDADERRRQEQQ